MTKKLHSGSNETSRNNVSPASTSRVPALSEISEDRWKRIAFEASVLDQLMAEKRSRSAAMRASTILGWSVAKTYRKLKLYREAGHALVLAKTTTGRDWRSQLTSEQDAIIDRNLKLFLRKHAGKRVKEFVKMALVEFERENVTPPSKRTIRRRYERLPERTRYAHRNGAEAAAEKYDIERGSTPETHFPLERIQLDHTYADAWVMSDDYTIALGRPTVTLVIDEFSRIILGILVTFGHPSVEELAEAMAIAVLPKEGWMRSQGIAGVDWPWHGVPASIFVDRGVDFTSSAFQRGCQKWRIALSHRARPHHGGIVERAIRLAMEETKDLPGGTRFSKTRRRKDRVDPAATAKLTLRDYQAHLVQKLVVEYPHRIHPALGMTPAEKWNLGVHQFGEPRKVEDPNAFYLDFLKAERRKLEKYGVMVSYLKYRSRKLQPLINQAKSVEMLVKRDPADVSRAFVEDPRGGGYIELTNELTAGKGISVAEWDKARRELKAKLPGEQLSATGILGFVRKVRASCGEKLSPRQQESKLNRTKRRNAQREEHRAARSRRGLPKSQAAPEVTMPARAFDPAKLPIFANSGDAR